MIFSLTDRERVFSSGIGSRSGPLTTRLNDAWCQNDATHVLDRVFSMRVSGFLSCRDSLHLERFLDRLTQTQDKQEYSAIKFGKCRIFQLLPVLLRHRLSRSVRISPCCLEWRERLTQTGRCSVQAAHSSNPHHLPVANGELRSPAACKSLFCSTFKSRGQPLLSDSSL